MIVLDASVLIAVLDQHDASHGRAQALLTDHLGDRLAMHVVTRAEVLVGPARTGRAPVAERQLDRLEIQIVDLPGGHAAELAQLRVDTGVKLPDCCVLLAASHLGATVATFDDRLARAAAARRIAVLR